ncbi:histone-fold-containing protein [Mycena alexandri]|uniref:Histone-fold-containing protein n=1 Tax=Mycena alexandri TaxID=1745969 RepID=A0AAD6S650_9AGAR|nr:histone-fold-containing protein [Mycena alexandri]
MLKKMKRDFRDMDELPVSTAGKAPASTAGKEPAKTEGAKAGKKTVTKKAAAPAADGEKTARRPTRRTSTRSSSRSTPTPVSQTRPWHPELVRQRHLERIASEASKLAQYSKKSTPDFGLNIKPSVFGIYRTLKWNPIATSQRLLPLESSETSKSTPLATISSWEIQTSAHLILPGELAKHAISEGTKSVTNFSSAATTK